ncbi:3-beta-hydroxysteroid-Delta(8),Delta(7)-isomerase [Lasiodiplodia theobromae]|uniref:3-beta-hydroxysteroid-Delta(8), Delta(7)-isomerase n=1 Tax=Lasiodiplodia theobromae TaxID=45133 RepID=A0A5N5DJF4_9PEZI|nr:3-beta-hydroxysteroid-Delta(8),Delta(7)-isomerase [Lasiodiplodia theobromae]
MARATINDLITSKLPALFGCDGFLPLAADCYSASPPNRRPTMEPANLVASAASAMAESATAAAVALEPAAEVPIQLNATKIPHPSHPYYPLEVDITGYLANAYTVPQLLASFAAGCAVVFLVTYLVAKKIRPTLRGSELLQILWFVAAYTSSSKARYTGRDPPNRAQPNGYKSGFYVYNFRRLGSSQHLFGELWKEYALSDSRYLTQDPFVLCMETITAVCWGPLSFVVAHMITTEHPLRYPLQAIVSLGQLYGDVLYYATAMFDHFIRNLNYTRPESYYFWFYFVFMNAFWIVIPIVLIANSLRASGRAFRAVARVEKCLNASPVSPKRKKEL